MEKERASFLFIENNADLLRVVQNFNAKKVS